MSKIQSFFPTQIYRADKVASAKLNRELEQASLMLAQDDGAGIKWCEKHGYPGYTSYASLNDLPWRIPAFKALEKVLDRHAAAFAKALHWDLRGGKPVCDSLWVNVLPEGGSHTSHIHTNSVLSGTYYVAVPEGAGPIVYEDPRHAMMMAAPPLKANAPLSHKAHVPLRPAVGSLLFWESWLRHEVPVNRAEGLRISVSFNYVIGEK
ncbi:MAG: hypothetical protein KGO53_01750 [Alphaproteobacteria bacterium]|nr:hypothetical protein [Alphaproteobacteria bacterium]